MTYYFISLNPASLEKFQDRILFLSGGKWIKDKDNLNEVLAQAPASAVFFLQQDADELDDWAIAIRASSPASRIIFVTNGMDTHQLKEHQSSEAGADAYIHDNVDEDMLADILRSIVPEVMRPPKTLAALPDLPDEPVPDDESTQISEPPIPGPEMEEIFSDLSALKKVLEHPLSREMDLIFSSIKKSTPGFEIPDINVPPVPTKKEAPTGDDMSDKDQELSLDDLGELELGSADEAPPAPEADEGLSLSLDDTPELELGGEAEPQAAASALDEGLDLGFDIVMTQEIIEDEPKEDADSFGELSLGDDDSEEEGFSLDDGDDEEVENEPTRTQTQSTVEVPEEDIGIDLEFAVDDVPAAPDAGEELSLGGDDSGASDLSLSDENDLGLDLGGDEGGLSLGEDSPPGMDLGADEGLNIDFGSDEPTATGDLSDDARKKLMEIDEIMVQDASQVNISMPSMEADDSEGLDGLDFSASSDDGVLEGALSSDDLNMDNMFSSESEDDTIPTPAAGPAAPVKAAPLRVLKEVEEDEEEEVEEIKPKKKKSREEERSMSEDFKEISGAYSGEMERTQATIANLRADRGELLARIQQLEEEKVLHNRQSLTSRAELDERKIELTIIRKKLNEEINELKDRMRMQDERRLILEEKNRILTQELDKAGQKNKIDIKKVQMRERDLEQKLELLKSDAETQIKNRDLKILELKRKIDAMEFDMESISQQEKRSVENRFELEDKLDKAIKTLRSAISVLEDETDRGNALDVLKKNIDV